MLTDGAFGWLNDHLPGKNEAWLPVGFLYGAVAVLGAILVLLFTSAITLGAEEFCGCSSPVWASWSFLVVLVSTTTMWIAAIVRLPSWVERTAAVAGYLGTAGVLTFGLLRALSDATDIIN